MAAVFAGYEHLLDIARRRQWDEQQIDLSADARSWPATPVADRQAIARLVAGFAVAEHAVARDIRPFAAAAGNDLLAACFRAQAVDEQRHARFFDRVSTEVLGVPDRTALRRLVGPAFLELFEERLRNVARSIELAVGRLAEGVALYHLLLEGVVLSAGQLALLERLSGGGLPGLRRGAELVSLDERWHIGLGVHVLQDLAVDSETTGLAGRAAGDALAAWGELIDPAISRRVIALHRGRLRACGSAREARVLRATPAGASA